MTRAAGLATDLRETGAAVTVGSVELAVDQAVFADEAAVGVGAVDVFADTTSVVDDAPPVVVKKDGGAAPVSTVLT